MFATPIHAIVHTSPSRSIGAALLFALMFMLLLSLIASTVMQSAVLQLHMAGNDQFLEEALHKAQAIAGELSLAPENFLLEANVGDSNCRQGKEIPGCDFYQLHAPVSAGAFDGYVLDYRVARLEPLWWKGFPIREPEHTASSNNGVNAALFEINVRLDGTGSGQARAHIVQGIVVRVPALRE